MTISSCLINQPVILFILRLLLTDKVSRCPVFFPFPSSFFWVPWGLYPWKHLLGGRLFSWNFWDGNTISWFRHVSLQWSSLTSFSYCMLIFKPVSYAAGNGALIYKYSVVTMKYFRSCWWYPKFWPLNFRVFHHNLYCFYANKVIWSSCVHIIDLLIFFT